MTAVRSERRGRLGFAILLIVLLGLLVWAARQPPEDGPPLDPRSSGERGARGLVLFLEEQGASVDLSRDGPGADTDIALVLVDRLDEGTGRDVLDWVRGGGTLVNADPGSPLSAPLAEEGGDVLQLLEGDLDRGVCDIDALDGADEIDVPGALVYAVDDRLSCFGDDEAAFVVSEDVGDGRIVSLGAPTLFDNEQLDERDHAVVAGSLLAAEDGARVTILEEPPPGEGDEDLADLVADGVKAALAQLAIAFLLYVLLRARRLGRPVAEPLPVQIAGSELVAAVGDLLHRGDNATRTATVLQQDTRRRLARRLGLPVDADADLVARAAAARTGADPDVTRTVLSRPVSGGDDDLVALARDLDDLRQEILHDRSV